MRVIVASNNAHKIKELETIGRHFGMELATLRDEGIPGLEIEETGTTFEENSRLKAVGVGDYTGRPAIADDSGICVDAIGGAPGVYSARYAGEPCDDAANRVKLLEAIKDVPWEQRTARFVCAITFYDPATGEIIAARGEVEGRIAFEERGEGGFGYDNIFVPLGAEKTFAEIPQAEKDAQSHRSRAVAALIPKLADSAVGRRALQDRQPAPGAEAVR